jgi:hypothetical protein
VKASKQTSPERALAAFEDVRLLFGDRADRFTDGCGGE